MLRPLHPPYPFTLVLLACALTSASARAATDLVYQPHGVLRADDAASDDRMGEDVDVFGDLAIVGAPLADGQTGAAYVFERVGGDWTQVARLTASDAAGGDRFGWAVAIDGDVIVVGAPFDGADSGSAYVFERDGTAWSEVQKLRHPTPSGDDEFGESVDVHGARIVVGAYRDNTPTTNAGSATIFARQPDGLWLQEAFLTEQTPSFEARFGRGVAIHEERVVVGAYFTGAAHPGEAFVYHWSGSSWVLTATLTPPMALDKHFGKKVDVLGDTLLIGADQSTVNGVAEAGAVYVYAWSGGAWSLQQQLTAPALGTNDAFGYGLDLGGAQDADTIAVGAVNYDGFGADAGGVFLWRRAGTSWIRVASPIAPEVDPGDRFGRDVALSGCDTLLATAYLDDHSGLTEAGSAFAFLPGGEFFCDASDGSLASCPCANPGAPNTGCDLPQGTGGVELRVCAQETSPNRAATLVGNGFPAAAAPTVALIRSTTREAAPVVFGDGLRCLGVPLVRVDTASAANGSSVHELTHGSMAGAGAFHYQLWFRSTPAMYCTPDAFNLSGGRTLVWP